MPAKPRHVSQTIPDVIDVIGAEAMIRFAIAFGGERFRIPVRIDETHKIARALGLETAERLRDHFADTAIEVPIWMKREAIIRQELARDPQPTLNEIAARAGVSYRTVRDMRHRAPFAAFKQAARPLAASLQLALPID